MVHWRFFHNVGNLAMHCAVLHMNRLPLIMCLTPREGKIQITIKIQFIVSFQHQVGQNHKMNRFEEWWARKLKVKGISRFTAAELWTQMATVFRTATFISRDQTHVRHKGGIDILHSVYAPLDLRLVLLDLSFADSKFIAYKRKGLYVWPSASQWDFSVSYYSWMNK